MRLWLYEQRYAWCGMLGAMSDMIRNKKAHFTYELLERFDAGIELSGSEVRALRQGLGKLEGAHIVIRGGEAYVVGMSIPAYQPNNMSEGYDAERPRRLLLTKKELATLVGLEATKGLTLVPISLYNKGSRIKLAFSSARGKKKYDKRESIKERDTKRDVERLMKRK